MVSKSAVVPEGSSFEKRRREGLQEMARSEEVGSRCRPEGGGLPVKATPRGALVEAVATDAPRPTCSTPAT